MLSAGASQKGVEEVMVQVCAGGGGRCSHVLAQKAVDFGWVATRE